MIGGNKYLNQIYPLSSRHQITEIKITEKIFGYLDLSSFVNLKKISCSQSELLEGIEISKNISLEVIEI